MKRKLSLLLAAAMMLTMLAGCAPKKEDNTSASGSASGSTSADASTPVNEDAVNFMVLSGPTGVGASYLIDTCSPENAAADAPFVLNTTVAAENTEVTNALVNGSADIAAVATNVAANLSAKTNGGIQVLAINTLGVLYILEKGDTVHSMADLKGKTLYATGQGANPEYVLNYLLNQNDVDPADMNIEWLTPQEITAKMETEAGAICMLPVPAATAVLMKNSDVREAISLSAQWDALDSGALAQGCIVARTEFVKAHPELVKDFRAAYETSITYMKDEANRADAAALVAKYGITPNDKIAAKAIPQCNLVCITGAEMKDILEQFYSVLFQANPAAIGNAMPYDAFYYGVE